LAVLTALRKQIFITVSDPVASFMLQDTFSLCPPLLIQPQNTSENFTGVLWQFNDGNTSTLVNPSHYYTNAGKYILKLIVQGYGNCYDTARKVINLKGPGGTLKYDSLGGCKPYYVKFSANTTNTSSYVWDFGDGNTQTTLSDTISHIYKIPGVFVPKLIISDTAGCKIPIENPDTIRIAGTIARFGIALNEGCDSSFITLIDSSVTVFDKIQNQSWNFGDGSATQNENLSHYYKKSGIYTISLFQHFIQRLYRFFGKPMQLNVYTSPQIASSFPDSACILSSSDFKASLLNNINESVTWKWYFGNGDSIVSQNTSYIYSSAGSYIAGIQATSAHGCTDTAAKTITIMPLPNVDAGLDTVLCLGQSVMLQPSGASIYSWNYNASLNCFSCTAPVATPQSNTTYYVTGEMYNCKATDSIQVTVKMPATLSFEQPLPICAGSTAQLQVSGAELYNWQPATALNNASIGNPIANPQATVTYTVIGSDSKKCFSDTAQITLEVIPHPQFKIADSIVSILVGSSYQIVTTSSSDVIGWQWNPATALSCSNCPQPLTQPVRDISYVAKAYNSHGCSTEDRITVNVLCKNENLFMPNTFSPNGDGMNDKYYPRGKGLFTIKSLRIFSRWGNVVFQKNNFQANNEAYGWDGKYDGKLLTPDVYVYIIEVLCDNGALITSKGNITLLR